MSKTLAEITQEVVQLPKQQRLALASLLLELEDRSVDPRADEAGKRSSVRVSEQLTTARPWGFQLTKP